MNLNFVQSTTRQTVFGAFEFFWSAFSCLLYLIGSAVFAGLMNCSARQFRSQSYCRWMLASEYGVFGRPYLILFIQRTRSSVLGRGGQ